MAEENQQQPANEPSGTGQSGPEQTPPPPEIPEIQPAPPDGIEQDPGARTWGMLCHLLGLCGYVIPFGNIIGPLVVWLTKKDEYEFVADQEKEALNFQISLTIYMLVASLTLFICIGVVLVPAIAVAGLVFIILGSIKANGGVRYRYPLTIRLIK